jgi:hypothetical protein
MKEITDGIDGTNYNITYIVPLHYVEILFGFSFLNSVRAR